MAGTCLFGSMLERLQKKLLRGFSPYHLFMYLDFNIAFNTV